MSLPLTESPSALQLAEVQRMVADDMHAVDKLIEKRLHSDVALINQVSRYIIQSGGKRLRPVLVLLCAKAFDYRGEAHLPLAAIAEFIHTATLLHDDVVDASLLRRGQDTANSLWGNEASVLVGDFLYSRAFQMMVELDNMRIMDILAETTNVIAEGEVLQLLNCHNPDTTIEQYLDVIRSKTAKLFEASARLGAVVCGASPLHEQATAAYGLHLGIAFQVIDDVLDYYGSADEIGKNVGDDLAEGKPTLPLIHVMNTGTPKQADTVRRAIRTGGLELLEEVVRAVESTQAIDYTARAARAEANSALEAISAIPSSPYKHALQALAEFSVSRSY